MDFLRSLLLPIRETVAPAPLPWRVMLTLGPLILLALWLGPSLFHLAARVAVWVLERILLGLALLEYQAVRRLRQRRRRPPQLLHTLEGGMVRLIESGRRVGAASSEHLVKRLVRLSLVVLAVIPILSWYLAPKTEPGTWTRSRLDRGIALTAAIDVWVVTGSWPDRQRQPPRSKAESKPGERPVRRPPAKPRP
jgi:hypothetical protein